MLTSQTQIQTKLLHTTPNWNLSQEYNVVSAYNNDN